MLFNINLKLDISYKNIYLKTSEVNKDTIIDWKFMVFAEVVKECIQIVQKKLNGY